MNVYLRAKFQVSSISLTRFRQEGNFTPTTQNEPLKSPPRLELRRGLSHLIKSLSFVSRQNFLYSWTNTVKSSRQVKECDYIIINLLSLISETALKFVHNTRCKIIRYVIFQVKNT